MAGIDIEIDTSQLRALAVKLEREGGAVGAAAAAAVRSTARNIQTTAKALCPIASAAEENAIPGELRDSISTTYGGDGRFLSFSADIGTDVRYAQYVEFGTSEMAAEPFLGPAFDRHAPELETKLAATAAKAIL